MLGQGAQAPSTEVQQLAFSTANFFKSRLCVKTGEVEVNLWIVIEK